MNLSLYHDRVAQILSGALPAEVLDEMEDFRQELIAEERAAASGLPVMKAHAVPAELPITAFNRWRVSASATAYGPPKTEKEHGIAYAAWCAAVEWALGQPSAEPISDEELDHLIAFASEEFEEFDGLNAKDDARAVFDNSPDYVQASCKNVRRMVRALAKEGRL